MKRDGVSSRGIVALIAVRAPAVARSCNWRDLSRAGLDLLMLAIDVIQYEASPRIQVMDEGQYGGRLEEIAIRKVKRGMWG